MQRRRLSAPSLPVNARLALVFADFGGLPWEVTFGMAFARI